MSLVQHLGNVALECRIGGEVLVNPTLLSDVGEERIEQRQIGAGIDRQLQHIVLAGFYLTSVDRHGVARVNNNDLRAITDSRNHVVKEQIRLVLQWVGSDKENRIGKS